VIPDSNDRVQAVIDRQVIALWDSLVQNEWNSGELRYLPGATFDDALCFQVNTASAATRTAVVAIFINWIAQRKYARLVNTIRWVNRWHTSLLLNATAFINCTDLDIQHPAG
jgi:hypothetical protein